MAQHLVGRGHAGVEDGFGDGHECRVGDPCAVVTVSHLPLLVSGHLRHVGAPPQHACMQSKDIQH